MDPTGAVYWFLPLFILQLALVYAFYRTSSFGAGTPDRSEPDVDHDAGTVTCPDCGVENELGYTYCHGCVGELPGAPSRPTASILPGQRGTR